VIALTPGPQRLTARHRVATVVSEVLAPIVVIPLVIVVIGLESTQSVPRGLGLAAIAIAFSAGLPYLVLMLGVRHGRFGDRHVQVRHERPALLAFTLVSVAFGLAVLSWLNAPRDLIALVAAMVAGITVTLVATRRWKISIHASCIAGVIGALGLLISPQAWFLLPLVVLVGWSRVALRHHSHCQVAAGGAAGVIASTFVITLLS
jgi:membrane-associated phospholipid phosphatase